jgi:hypothetical protein
LLLKGILEGVKLEERRTKQKTRMKEEETQKERRQRKIIIPKSFYIIILTFIYVYLYICGSFICDVSSSVYIASLV